MIARRIILLSICALAVCGSNRIAAAQAALEQIAAPWIKDQHSALALLAGPRQDGLQLAGIAIHVEPGWKTYWRTPGDSGVPPRFDFSASENVSDVTVEWPAPKQFPDGAGGISFGYQGDVVLPLHIKPTRTDAPVTLRAKINYAVCAKLCLPVEAEAALAMPSTPDTASVAAIAAARGHVPQPATIDSAAAFGIRGVARSGDAVTITVAAAPGEKIELFAEGPTPDWALPPPELRDTTADGLRHFSFVLDGLPPGASAKGAALKLTLAGADQAREYTVRLD